MTDNKKIDAAIKALDVGGVTLADLRSAPLEQVVKLRNLLGQWQKLAEAEVQDRAKRTAPKG
jgi:hypothetical protein